MSVRAAGFTALFVRRPVLAIVVNALIVVAGLAAFNGIEVRELPAVDRPVVTVTVDYAGASPETVDSEITSEIESAAYLIASEAMANAAKHSGARHCRVEVIAGSDLAITIQDDGQGLTEHPTAGSGWHTMVERAEELGGTCSLGPGERSGVAVRASLPLHGR